MNKRKWSDPNVPIAALGLKLSEEAAEVGTEISDAIISKRRINEQKVLVELNHVEFFVKQLRKRFAV